MCIYGGWGGRGQGGVCVCVGGGGNEGLCGYVR